MLRKQTLNTGYIDLVIGKDIHSFTPSMISTAVRGRKKVKVIKTCLRLAKPNNRLHLERRYWSDQYRVKTPT